MRAWVTTLLDVVGAAAIVTGVALLSVPVAFIVAGAATLAISWRLAR